MDTNNSFLIQYFPFALLVIFECVYVFINSMIDKDFDVRRVFDYRRMANIKINIYKNLISIIVIWIVYIGTCEVVFRAFKYSKSGTDFIGYMALLFLLMSIYMLNSGMTEKTIYKALLIIIFISAPLILFITIVNLCHIVKYMGIITLCYGIVFVIMSVLFVHYWMKEDVR